MVSQLPELKKEEIEQYLSSGLFHGIGKATARAIVNYFGSNTLSVLDNSPEKLSQIPGFGQHRSNKILKAWTESKKNPLHGVIAQLLGAGTSLGLTLKICEHYGYKTSEVLKRDPYRLVDEVEGIGFKTADKLALSLGVSIQSEARYEKALVHVLKEALGEGHCFLPESQLLARAVALLEKPSYTPETHLLGASVEGLVERQILVSQQGRIYLRAAYRAEVSVALRIKALLNRSSNSTQGLERWLAEFGSAAHRELSGLSNEQISAIIMAVKYPVSIITGGPGRGKTFVLKTLVEYLNSTGAKIALAAPTGKAANRMQNAIAMEAGTIHRLLQWQGQGQSFVYNEDNWLDIDWLVVDEFSMVDVFLFNSLLKALPPTAKILLVGDKDQLPSVGAGMVLRDLLASGVMPATRLEKIYRQRHESPIVYTANDINQGVVPVLQKFHQPSAWMDVADCAMIEAEDPQATAATIVELAKAMVAENVDINQQLMVLAPQKEGPAGVHNLNSLLQPIFNPNKDKQDEVKTGSVVYRVGDRVMQLKNRYDTIPPVMNGELGWVILVDAAKKQVRIAFEGGASVDYYPGNFEEIMHAYTTTCHKAQGSEFPYVIFPILKSNYRMLTRQLLYTTITRAQGTFIAVGQSEALELAVSINKPAKRFTLLVNHLLLSLEELNLKMQSLNKTKKVSTQTTSNITIAQRLRQRGLEATTGQKTTIGSLVLQLYEAKYGFRPSKQFEQVGEFRFKTYHYEMTAVELIDGVIDTVIRNEDT